MLNQKSNDEENRQAWSKNLIKSLLKRWAFGGSNDAMKRKDQCKPKKAIEEIKKWVSEWIDI